MPRQQPRAWASGTLLLWAPAWLPHLRASTHHHKVTKPVFALVTHWLAWKCCHTFPLTLAQIPPLFTHLTQYARRDDSQAVLYPVPSEDAQGRGSEGVVAHMRDLRQRTLRSLSGAHRRGGMMNDPEATPLMSSDGGGGGGGEGFVNGEVEGNGVDLSGGADNVPPLLLHHHPHQHQLDLMSMPGTSGAVAPVLPLSVPPVGGAFAAVAAAAVAATAARGVEGGSGGGGGDVGTGVAQQWDASVAALCESVLRDGGVSPEVQQQAAALRAALIAVPASPAHATVPATAQLL